MLALDIFSQPSAACTFGLSVKPLQLHVICSSQKHGKQSHAQHGHMLISDMQTALGNKQDAVPSYF